MEKYITDERTGLKYELVGDYYIIAGDDEPEEEQKPIGIWGSVITNISAATNELLCRACKSAVN